MFPAAWIIQRVISWNGDCEGWTIGHPSAI
jgi:hypothetical protein